MYAITSRRANIEATSSDDSDDSDDDNGALDGPTIRSDTPTTTTKTVQRRQSKKRRQSLSGSAPLSNLSDMGSMLANEPATDPVEVQKYRRGSVLSKDNSVVPPLATRSEIDTYDLTQITDPTTSRVLEVLRERWNDGLIYTSVGDCLVSVNPYRWIEALYNPKVIEGCLAVSKGAEHFPHVYQIANDAYHALKTGGGAQSIVIAGESGSGKTENMKKCLQFFTRIAMGESALIQSVMLENQRNSKEESKEGDNTTDDAAAAAAAAAKEGSNFNSAVEEETQLERRILATNPLLEALGNAKTSRNDNSSRFGRWIEISFERTVSGGSGSEIMTSPRVTGCECQSYLLEKSRVTKQQPGDRNFHIFYMLLEGSSSSQRMKYSINPTQSFHYLPMNEASSTPRSKNDKTNEVERFAEFLEAGKNVGLKLQEMDDMLLCIASCLHLGNVAFESVDGSSCRVHSDDGDAQKSLEICSSMLGMDANELSTSICFRTIQMRSSGEEMQVPMAKDKAEAARDALAKTLYHRLFVWLVERLNRTLSVKKHDTSFSKTTIHGAASASVGMLDIFGFEIMGTNEFEQLCINYVNEKLQYFFNRYTFDEEVALYEREGVQLEPTEFSQNLPVLQLFEKRAVGILALLDEELIRPTGNDKSFCRKVTQKNGQHPNFEKSRFSEGEFVCCVCFFINKKLKISLLLLLLLFV